MPPPGVRFAAPREDPARIDQARAAPWRDVPRLGAQRHPGGASRSFGGDHLGRGDRAVIIADLDALTQIMLSHAMPPAADS